MLKGKRERRDERVQQQRFSRQRRIVRRHQPMPGWHDRTAAIGLRLSAHELIRVLAVVTSPAAAAAPPFDPSERWTRLWQPHHTTKLARAVGDGRRSGWIGPIKTISPSVAMCSGTAAPVVGGPSSQYVVEYRQPQRLSDAVEVSVVEQRMANKTSRTLVSGEAVQS